MRGNARARTQLSRLSRCMTAPRACRLPDMYGKNLTFKTGGVDGCKCAEILDLIANGKLDASPLITHTFPLREIEKAYKLFEQKQDGVMKIAIRP